MPDEGELRKGVSIKVEAPFSDNLDDFLFLCRRLFLSLGIC